MPYRRSIFVAELMICLLAVSGCAAAKAVESSEPAGTSDARRSGAGGVALYKAAELLGPIDVRLSGARAEWVIDHLELVPAEGPRLICPPLDKEYIALALRCVFGGEEDVPGKLVAEDERCIVVSTGRERYGEVVWKKELLPRPWKSVPVGSAVKLSAGPGVGILSTSQPSAERITYYGPIRNTRMGKVLMEADFVLSPLMNGVDGATGRIVDFSRVPGFMTWMERRVRHWTPPPSAPAEQKEAEEKKWWQSGSTWFVLVPDRFTLKLDRDGNKLQFAETRMKLIAWTGVADPLDRASDEFAHDVSKRYLELAEVYPPLRDLIDVAKAVCFVRWMREAGIAADTTWARNCPLQSVETIENRARIRTEKLSDADGKPTIEKRPSP